MAMIPYEDLVASLQQWRMNQGLPVGASDYLGARTFEIGVPMGGTADEAAAEAYSVGDSTSEVDASDLEVMEEEFAEPVAVGEYAEQPAYDDGYQEAPAAYEEAPAAYEEAPAAFDEAPAAFDEAPAAFEEAPAAYEEAPAAFEEAPAYEEAPAAFEEAPAYEEAPATAPVSEFDDAPTAYSGDPAEDLAAPDAAGFEMADDIDDAAAMPDMPEMGELADDGEATMIAADPGDLASADDAFAAAPYADAEPPPLEAAPDDGTMDVADDAIVDAAGADDEATRVGFEDDPAAPPPLAPPPDDEQY